MNSATPRALPSVDKVLQLLGQQPLPRVWVSHLIRTSLQTLRDEGQGVADLASFVQSLDRQIARFHQTRIIPVINGTGVLIHTNLGRIPIPRPALERALEVGTHYNNLEFDFSQGRRGDRAAYLETLLALLTGAEAATVVNNGASALVLILRMLTRGADKRDVLISRGELIEIGGGFRIPEILEASGARLVEVGSTNKTTLRDYAKALTPNTALILKVHKSNFYMEGFVAEPTVPELADLSKKYEVPLVCDLGSGAMTDTQQVGTMDHEPTPKEFLHAGADLVCFSGDKLFGGPQAGIIVGNKRLVRDLKKEPFFRALRCDKLILTILEECAQGYLNALEQQQLPEFPLFQMIHATHEELTSRIIRIRQQLEGLPVIATLGRGESKIGGGTMPRTRLPSPTLNLQPLEISLEKLSQRLRSRPLPIVGYLSDDFFKLDFRTIFVEQDEAVACALKEVLLPKL